METVNQNTLRTASDTVQVGSSIHRIYFAPAVQGSERATVKLVKQ